MSIFPRNFARFHQTFTAITSLLCCNLLLASIASSSPERPLIFIPGILGSTLEKDGEVVWGNVLSMNNFRRLRIVDGPKEPDDGLIATQIINQVQVLGPIKIREYDSLISTLLKGGYAVNETLIMFPYDWRQSNFTTAAKLAHFIENHPNVKGKDFDIIAHSMGGIVARIYVSNYDYQHRLKRLITLGTPFEGAAKIVNVLVQGWGPMANWLAGGMTEVRQTVLSFPSIYQLLPTYDNCCIYGKPDDKQRRPYDILTEGWQFVKWYGTNIHALPSQKKIDAALFDASTLRDLLHHKLRGDIDLYTIAGDKIDTLGQFYLDPTKGGNPDTSFVQWNGFRGDGTVPLKSASNNQPDRAFTSLAKHETIFDDENVRFTIKRILGFGGPTGPERFMGNVESLFTTTGKSIVLQRMNFDMPSIVESGSDVTLAIELTAEERDGLADVGVSGTASTPQGKQVLLHFILVGITDEGRYSTVRFVARMKASEESGVTQINVNVQGLNPISDYFVVPTKH